MSMVRAGVACAGIDHQHQLADREALYSLMHSHPLGAWVCLGLAGSIANHVPLLPDLSQRPNGTLIGHVSRANPVWREVGPATALVVMLRGPQGFVTPGWYSGHAVLDQVVPTWNYVEAPAHGLARVIDDQDWLRAIVGIESPSIAPKASSWPARTRPCPTGWAACSGCASSQATRPSRWPIW